MSNHDILTGLDVLVERDFAPLRGRRVGLLCHPASVDRRLRHAAPLLSAALGADLRCLFGPQHGLRGETQDNMVEWRGFADPATRLPAHSLYGEHRKPTAGMLADLDLLVVDLQDVGARYYTFIWTMLLCLEACAEQGKSVLVLDRPNPLGDAREGNVLDPDYRSFVGLEPLPMRHGLTVGELARLFRRRRGLDVDLDVIGCRGLDPGAWFDETGLPWVLPSPNMPTLDTAAVYPGMCLFEGTELSEGRGTTRPFEIFGAPWIEPERYADRLAGYDLPGLRLRPLHFEPTFQKHRGCLCGGLQLHVVDRRAFRPVLTAVAALCAARALWPDEFRWKEPPYEYETVKPPIDILAGGPGLREGVEAGADPRDLVAGWDAELRRFADELRELRGDG